MDNKYIISLTTIPSKFDNLHLTIDSLVNQTILPSKIIVNIPKIYSFRMNNSEIPENRLNDFLNKYSKCNCIVNLLETDYGPGTKLLGLLTSDVISDIDCSNAYIILVDDDVIYKPYMIETFDREIQLNNMHIGSFYVYEHKIKIGQGADGFLIKLDKLDMFINYYDIFRHEDYINYHDDLYISYYFYLLNENIQKITPPNNCLIYDNHSDTFIEALFHLNGKYSRSNVNQKAFEILDNLNNEGHFNFLKAAALT